MIPMPAFLAGLSTTAQVSLSAFAFFVFYVFYWLQRVPKGFPPGPFRLPIVGNLPDYGEDPTKTILPEKYRKYGGIFSMQMGKVLAIVITEPDILVSAFKRGGLKTAGRPEFVERLNATCMDGRDMFMTQPDERWSNVRKFLHANVFKPSALLDLGIAERFQQQLMKMFKTIDEANGKPIDPIASIRFILSATTLNVLFGREYHSTEDPEFQQQYAAWQQVFDGLAVARPADFLPNWLGKLIDWNRCKEKEPFYQGLDKVAEWALAQVAEHEENIENFKKSSGGSLENYQPRDLCDRFLMHRENAPEEFLKGRPKEAWLDNLSISLFMRNLFAGGSDTTTSFIAFAILLAANYPEKQKKIQAELDSVMGDRTWATMEDEANCPYTKAFMKEVHRYRPAATGFFHTTTKPVELTDSAGKSYHLPQDVNIFCVVPPIFRDEAVWGDANNFRPERFLDMTTQQEAGIFFPFGVGPRACPGQNLAQITSWHAVSSILKRYEILPANGKSLDEEYAFGFVLYPRAYEVSFKLRSSK